MTPKFRFWYEREDFYPDENYMRDVWKIEYTPNGEIVLNDDYTFNPYTNVSENIYAKTKIYLMQYTGLTDKNGIEVYLNDIVEDEYGHRYEVVFEGDCLRCNGLRINAGGYRPKNRWFGKDLEIIGNRYENPELLEVEKWQR